jgi:hypothetical protein
MLEHDALVFHIFNVTLGTQFSGMCFFCGVGRDSSVGIATRYGLGGPGIESRRGPGPPVPLDGVSTAVQWIPAFFPGGKATGAWR